MCLALALRGQSLQFLFELLHLLVSSFFFQLVKVVLTWHLVDQHAAHILRPVCETAILCYHANGGRRSPRHRVAYSRPCTLFQTADNLSLLR